MSFEVIEIIDGGTFIIRPNWNWNDESGNIVRPVGYNPPEPDDLDFESVKEKLDNLLFSESVDLVDQVKLSYGRLLCTVLLKGQDIAEYFPEYQ